jgi:hypothetical protein
VSVVQRRDSALRLNVHFHVIVLDGVYVRDALGALVFVRTNGPIHVVDQGKARVAERVGESLGVNVHAEVAVPARDRARLERLCRYLFRPPLAQERLVETSDGRLRHVLKKPGSDGTVALVLEPLDLRARIAALIPPPRFHMVRYHGVLSSHSKLRSKIVPKLEDQGRSSSRSSSRRGPSWLRSRGESPVLRQVFQVDVVTCLHPLPRRDSLARGGHYPGADRQAPRQARPRPEASASASGSHRSAPPRLLDPVRRSDRPPSGLNRRPVRAEFASRSRRHSGFLRCWKFSVKRSTRGTRTQRVRTDSTARVI